MSRNSTSLILLCFVSLTGCTLSPSGESVQISLPTYSSSQSSFSSSVTPPELIPIVAEDDFFHLFNPSIEHEIVLEVTNSEMNQLQTTMESQFEKFSHYRSSLYVHGNFVYIENGIEKKRINDIGVRTHGNIFSRIPPNVEGDKMNPIHWRLSFDETFDLDPSSTDYITRKKRDFFGLENLVLKWNRTGAGTPYSVDPYVTESYGYSLYEQAGLLSPKAALAHVTLKIDGKSYNQGVMTMVEPVDDEFIAKRFPADLAQGNLYKALYQNAPADLTSAEDYKFGVKNEEANYFPAYDIATNESTNEGDDLKAFINGYKNLSGTALYNYLSNHIDLPYFIRFMAMNYLFGNPDDIRYNSNNYYMYFTSGDDPTLYFIPTDLDKGLGVLDWNPDGTLMMEQLPYTQFSSGNDTTALLVKKTILSKEAVYESLYESSLNQFVHSFFSYQGYQASFELAENIYRGYTQNLATWWGPKTMGLPKEISEYYCVATYKVEHLSLPASCS